jgi:hypothetical protein
MSDDPIIIDLSSAPGSMPIQFDAKGRLLVICRSCGGEHAIEVGEIGLEALEQAIQRARE